MRVRYSWLQATATTGPSPTSRHDSWPTAPHTVGPVSLRFDKSWIVLVSHQSVEADRCVDVFRRPDESFGFEEFRRDPEDMGVWTPVSYYSGRSYPTEAEAVAAARQAVIWLDSLLGHP
jgi:hypothetical protein